jgi:histidine triad (HIT) family protein
MGDCLFCRIVEGAIPAKILYEDDHCLGFADINPQARVHVLVIPKRHLGSLSEANAHEAVLLGQLLVACATVAREQGVAESGYRVVANTGREAGQSVFHLHFHVLGGRSLGWPPG